ncbi:MAG: acetyl-CoA carboxylase biotin carboxyl carrier protein [Frankia sp.]
MTTANSESPNSGAPGNVDQIVAMLRDETMAMCVQGSRAPSLVRVSAGDVSIQVEWWDNGAAADRSATQSASGAQPAATMPAAAPARLAAAPAAVSAAPEPAPATNKHEVCAQMVGVFYRAGKPGAKPFVSEGDVVAVGQQIGIVEAMKLMIPVEADRAGRVIEILIADGVAVEHGQPLLVMEPQR